MSRKNIIRAWKEENYRQITPEEKSLLPANPAGMLELTDAQLENAAGGRKVTYGGDDSCNSGIIACTLPLFCGVEQ